MFKSAFEHKILKVQNAITPPPGESTIAAVKGVG